MESSEYPLPNGFSYEAILAPEDFDGEIPRNIPERDVHSLANLKDERKFRNFMVAVAARSGRTRDMSNEAAVHARNERRSRSRLGDLHPIRPTPSSDSRSGRSA